MFAMTKWYLDCTTPAGEACIVYWGRVHVAGVGVSYASVLELPAGAARAEERRTLLGCAEPVIDGERTGVLLDRLGVRGRWMAEADPVSAELLRSGDGSVRWRCLAPRAEAEVIVGEKTYLGEGYVEQLEMTVAPWKLPVRSLRWGRAIAGGVSAVWIQWEGPCPRSDAWVNGIHDAHAVIGDDEIAACGVRIGLGKGAGGGLGVRRVVREGALGATALSGITALRAVVPAAMLDASEIKWVSRARARGEVKGRAVEGEGWAVHERVELGRGD
ncbi:MAG: hypothetical protein L6Q35_06105 [Phycisphaerales bacterium]|nr:hypothetical protein [Phycisphaerales bacterium]